MTDPKHPDWCPTCRRLLADCLCIVGISRYTDRLQDYEERLAAASGRTAPYAVCGRTGLEEE